MLIEMSAEPLDPRALAGAVRTAACGAVVHFAGVVRETSTSDPRAVERIVYEAYPALALPQLRAIAAAASDRFGPLEIAIAHRTGEVPLGEASVVIAVGAPHRGAAFDACEYAIDEIKARVAIWKQEVFADGERAWRPNT